MKSRARIFSHPLHPLLIAFPIAFYTGCLGADILHLLKPSAGFGITGWYLHIAALASALLAAVPGIIDYRHTVPPQSSAKKRALRHGLTNGLVFLLFAAALACKTFATGISHWVYLGLEAAGEIFLAVAGWMGGTLVYRNQIGVDIRYAHAGKWKELYPEQRAGALLVPEQELQSLREGQMVLLHAGDKRLVLAREAQGYVCFDDRCPHRGGSLAGGALSCGTVQCPWHGSQFNISTGAVLAGPAATGITVYPVTASGGHLHIHTEAIQTKPAT